MSRDGIIDGMARAIWVSSYADWVDSMTKAERQAFGAPVSLGGVDWYEETPEAPDAVSGSARELVSLYESENDTSIEDIEARARKAEGRSLDDEELGRYLAEMAMNTGVSWFDDHAKFDLKQPLLEAHYDGEFFEWSGLCKTTHQNPAKQSSASGPLGSIFLKREKNGWHVDARFPKKTLNYGPFKTKERGMRMREAIIESDLQRNPPAMPELGDIVHSKHYQPHEVVRVCTERDLLDGDRIVVFLKDNYGGELSVTLDEIVSIERRNPPSKRRLAQSMEYRQPGTEVPVPGERHMVVGRTVDGGAYAYNTDTGAGYAIHDEHPFIVAARSQAGQRQTQRGHEEHARHERETQRETQRERETRARRESEEYERYKREAEEKWRQAQAAQAAHKEREAAEREREERARSWREAGEREYREHKERAEREARAREQAREKVNGYPVVDFIETGERYGTSGKRGRYILVDRGEGSLHRWVTAHHWEGDTSWDHGNYFDDLAVAKIDLRKRAEAKKQQHAPPPRPRRPTGSDPRSVLGFSPGERLTTDMVKKRYRELARQHHPDVGGSTAKMQEINIAADELMASGTVIGNNPGPAHTWIPNPAGLTKKGERMYEHIKAGYGRDHRAAEIASRTVLARAKTTRGLKK
jgi:hypothetical protein